MGSSASLHGQVIINAANTGGTWEATGGQAASVRVRRTTGDIVLSPLSAQPDTGPYYQRLPSDLGGGSVALTAFHLHAEACSPPLNIVLPPKILTSNFCGRRGEENRAYIKLPSYGPIRTDHPTYSPVRVRLTGFDTPRERFMIVDLRRSPTDPRTRLVTITGDEHVHILPGVYHIAPVLADEDQLSPLLCDGLLTPSDVSVAPFDYVVELVADCDNNGVDDAIDIAEDRNEHGFPGTLDRFPLDGWIDGCFEGTCDGDVNCDQALDGFDVETQERAVGGDMLDYCQPNPDFNLDFALDGFDVEWVETRVGGGPCPWE